MYLHNIHIASHVPSTYCNMIPSTKNIHSTMSNTRNIHSTMSNTVNMNKTETTVSSYPSFFHPQLKSNKANNLEIRIEINMMHTTI
jgi:hypothetical protein